MARATQRFEILQSMAMRISVRLDMVYLNAISAAARNALVFVALQCLASLRLPVAHVWRRFAAAPEVAFFSLHALRASYETTCPRTAHAMRCSVFNKLRATYGALSRFFPVAPSRLEVASFGTVSLDASGNFGLLPINPVAAVCARRECARKPASGYSRSTLVPRWRVAFLRAVKGAIALEKQGSASLAWDWCTSERHAPILPRKHEYWRQAVENLKGAAAQADMFAA